MKKLVLLFLLCAASFSSATTRYIAQTAGTVTCNGSSHTAITPATWNATAEVAGDISYVCGTITGTLNTTALQFGWNGSSGNPIKLLFDTGADLTSPAWNANGAIDCAAHSFIFIDGQTNGKIENTADGDALANQIVTAGVNSSAGVCNNLTVQNLTVSNLYIKVQNSNNGTDDSAGINFGGAGSLITHNTIDHAATGIGMAGVSGTANQEISFNTMSFCQHCITAGAGATSAADNIKIHDNEIAGGAYLWDNSNNNYHHNAIIMVNESGFNPGITNLQIYNNYIHGLWSVTGHTTSMIFIDDYDTSQVSGVGFNNYINMDDPTDAGTGNGVIVSGHQMGWYNNTVVTAFSDKCFNPPNYPTAIFKNNICSMVLPAVGFSIANGPTSGGTKPDFNLYFHVASWSYGTGADTFAQWLTECACDTHSINGSDPKLNTDGTLQSGSPAISAGTNLTSLGITALNSDKAGIARPSTGPWDLGSRQFSSAPTVATPTFSPVAGTYTSTQSVTIATTTGGATLCYTTDGTTPTANGAGTCTHGTTYSGPVSVSTSEVLKAIGSLVGDTDSSVGSAAYTIQVVTPTFSPVAGTYSGTQNVTISTTTGGTTLCYTTDGSTPTANGSGTCTHGTTYSTPVSVASSLTLKAVGSGSGFIDSAVGSAAYTINSVPPAPTPAMFSFVGHAVVVGR